MYSKVPKKTRLNVNRGHQRSKITVKTTRKCLISIIIELRQIMHENEANYIDVSKKKLPRSFEVTKGKNHSLRSKTS